MSKSQKDGQNHKNTGVRLAETPGSDVNLKTGGAREQALERTDTRAQGQLL